MFSHSPQTTTLSASTHRSQRQLVPTPCPYSPKWTLAKVTQNKYHTFPLKAITETHGGCRMKCLKCERCVTNADVLPLSDQDLYDFIEPNPDEDPALSESDGQQSGHVSCIKVSMSVCVIYKILKWNGEMSEIYWWIFAFLVLMQCYFGCVSGTGKSFKHVPTM